nr:hypothetical protein [Babesia bovis]
MLKLESLLWKAVPRDEELEKLQGDLKGGPKETSGELYRRIVERTADAVCQADVLDSPVELNTESVLMLEDIAATGTCRYPWPVVKVLLLVVWSRLFDQIYEQEKQCSTDSMDSMDYAEERRSLLATLNKFECEPLTLQRLCEIPINQPYKRVDNLMHAYRRVLLVRQMLPEEIERSDGVHKDTGVEMEAILEKVATSGASWTKALDNPERRAWDEDS